MSEDGIGYHTPDIEKFSSGNVQSRILTLPLSLWYLVNGAIEELTFEQNWVQFGSATPEETAYFFLDAIDKMRPYPMIGTIIAFITEDMPDNVLLCDGGLYAQDDYPELYDACPSLVQYVRGRPMPWLQVPNLRDRTLIGESFSREMGAVGGNETHTLTVAEIPSHSHEYTPPVANIDIEAPGAPDILAAGMGLPTQTGVEGGGEAHNNMPPYYVVRYGIVAK
jgi:microcystin-dependent protein